MSMVRSEGDLCHLLPTFCLSALLLLQHGQHDGIHVDVTTQVVWLSEGASSRPQASFRCWRHFFRHISQMHKMCSWSKLFGHFLHLQWHDRKMTKWDKTACLSDQCLTGLTMLHMLGSCLLTVQWNNHSFWNIVFTKVCRRDTRSLNFDKECLTTSDN